MVTEKQKLRYQEEVNNRKAVRKKVMKSAKRTHLISLLIGAVLGLVISFAGIYASETGQADMDQLIVYFYGGLFLFIITFPLHVIIHEAGHLIFGLLTGYQFLSFRIFSTIFIKKDGHIHKKKFSIPGTAGQCLMVPPPVHSDGSFPFVLYNLGGGINNLIISLPFLLAAFFTQNIYLLIIYIAFAAAGILTGLTNMIPMNVGISNDGLNLFSMIKDTGIRDAFHLQLSLHAKLCEGKRITEFPTDIFRLSENTDDTNMLSASIYLFAYEQQLALFHFKEAEHMLSALEAKADQYPAIIYNSLLLERLFFMVLHHSPIEEIAAVYKDCLLVFAKAKYNIGVHRIRYVYETFLTDEEQQEIQSLIQKKKPKSSNRHKKKSCDQLYRDFLKAAEKYPVPGAAATQIEIVNYIRNNYNYETRTLNPVQYV